MSIIWAKGTTLQTGAILPEIDKEVEKKFIPRLVYKPHSVLPCRWHVRTSIWEIGCPITLAAYPEFKRDEQSLYSCLALLLAGVAWPQILLFAPVVSYTTFSPSPVNRGFTGSLFLWPGPADCSAPGVTRCHALWSADFPQKGFLLRSPNQPGVT